jgi:hypothetical protein
MKKSLTALFVFLMVFSMALVQRNNINLSPCSPLNNFITLPNGDLVFCNGFGNIEYPNSQIIDKSHLPGTERCSCPSQIHLFDPSQFVQNPLDVSFSSIWIITRNECDKTRVLNFFSCIEHEAGCRYEFDHLTNTLNPNDFGAEPVPITGGSYPPRIFDTLKDGYLEFNCNLGG